MSNSSSPKTILVTGATGKQGGAVIDSILASENATAFHLIAVTRDATSPQARRLAKLPGVSVISGDLSNADALFAAAGGEPVWGVFSVQVNSPAEEQQGKALVDAAAARGVRHFVYSSGDRGGPDRSAADPTEVANFAAKFRVEKHLEAAAGEGRSMTYTILRPVTFFENLAGDLHGRGFARMWQQMGDRKLQFVSTADIGWFAAQSFLQQSSEQPSLDHHSFPRNYRNAAITLVGDDLTQSEADTVFREVVGQGPMPLAPCVIASAVKVVKRDTVGDMFRWFAQHGYGGDVEECRLAQPQMKDFRTWLEENKGRWTQ